ncbi:MAG: selenocysteine-specific translation elongation factor [Chloroflexi bacterium]|nr:selenocysteine-specific translation elongation factor [Chloroflexota bacterium]MBU1751866.1 selenocysteine-specific translation elongation factor [Chloroflexota bacterium]
MPVIATAGHVDHGKSTLIKALTGIDPDRLPEEKEREMTIDLGFAWLTLPSGREMSIIDVPGHERFIKNMLAGVGSIDATLLVVAADEGPMPQTREHLDIIDLLGIQRGVVAITKLDLVDEDWLELVIEETREALAGTTLAQAPLVPVSAVSRAGLDDLLAALDDLIADTPLALDLGRPRLSVDRVFTVAGFGTVVTGTLLDGRLQVGQEVEIVPRGLKSRVRGLQTHQERLQTAAPGSRVAVNLGGLAVEDIARGDVVTSPGDIKSSRLIDVRLHVSDHVPWPVAHNEAVDAFIGAAEVPARVRVLGADALLPGETGWAQLRLAAPVALRKGDRYIVRLPSPSTTLGGGVVVDTHPRRHKRFRAGLIESLETLARGTPDEILLQALGAQPVELKEALARTGLPDAPARDALRTLLEHEQALLLDLKLVDRDVDTLPAAATIMATAGWLALRDRVAAALAAYHQRYPLRGGMPREELKSRLQLASRLFNQVLERAVSEGVLIEGEATVRQPTHQVTFTPDQQRRIDTLLSTLKREPFAPPSRPDMEQAVGEDVLASLIEDGTLVKVRGDILFHSPAYARMRAGIMEHLERDGVITVAQVRDLFNTSRKYAIAFMEHLDEARVTRRVGDERVLW